MKKHLQFLKNLVICLAVAVPSIAVAQINYTENFDSGIGTWSDDYFYETDVVPCNGAGAVVTNLYSFNPYAEIVSPSLGVSNGGQITMSYKYKILNYDSDLPTDPTENADNWGVMELYYATSPTGPWTMIQSITPANHVESVNCATKTASFFAPVGSTVYVAFAAGLNNEDSDFFIFLDEVSLTQAAPVTCSGAPAASAAVASVAFICNTQQTVLSLDTVYTNLGISYEWQSSVDGVTYTATAGTSSTYTTTQPATRWYRAKIMCGTNFVYSTPVQVVSSGLPCLCDIAFDPEAAIEPITQVTFAGINNTTSATVNGTPGVQNFTNLAPGQVVQGQSYPIALKGNTDGNYDNYFTVYFDWNHDGDLTDAGESYQVGFITASTGTDAVVLNGTIAVPSTAMPGLTNMRVLKLFDEFADSPCSSEIGLGYGQAEDYIVNILPPPTFDWVNVQHPPTMILTAGETGVVYAQGYEPGVTEAPGAGTGVTAWIGVSNQNTDPATWTTWIPATFNVQAGNNDEFMATIGAGLQPGTYYYASRFQLNGVNYVYGGVSGIWNAATSISGVLTVNCATAAPDANNTQTVCEGSTLASLEAEGDTIIWYAAETGNTPLPLTTVVADGIIYYAAQLPNGGCESIERTPVTANVSVVDAPGGDATQEFTTQVSLSDIVVEMAATGTVNYYATEEDAENGEDALSADDTIPAGTTTYYITQTVGTCESAPFAVTVGVTLGADAFSPGTFIYYPNPVNDLLNLNYVETITSVAVYNLLGQQVLSQTIGQSEGQLDMSSLSAGTYMVKVASGENIKTFKVVKN